MFKLIFVAVLLIGTTLSQKIEDLKNIDATEVTGKIFDELCKRTNVSDEATIKGVKDSGKKFEDCLKKFIDVEVVKNEIEEAKPRGALDEVFKKYCDKSQELKVCINDLVTSVTPCLDEALRSRTGDITSASDQLIDFVCYKDGDRIALFIAENGPECFTSKSMGIQECGEKAKSYVMAQGTKVPSKDQMCQHYDELSKCIVDSLVTCDTPTPANMMESLFRFIKKGTPCNKK